ncbi:MAG TPA: hypothetical protein VND15_00915 [Candidatus Acidoferrales bacterium]|nr:hypothetical protein [Candidatus Acidoferrales bacterium]
MIISYEDIIDEIWGLPKTDIVDLDSKVSEVIRSKGVTEPLEVANYLEKLLPGVKRDLETRINYEIEHNGSSRFIFNNNKLIGSDNIGKYELFSRLTDRSSNLVSECNRINESKHLEQPFRFTNYTLQGFVNIRRPVKNETDFKLLIDGLYQTIYETSGSCSRIPENFKDNEQFILFEIKYLRSLFDHDPELDRDPDKKARLISQVCIKYMNKTTIIGLSPSEFLDFQEKLLRATNTFLEIFKIQLLN